MEIKKERVRFLILVALFINWFIGRIISIIFVFNILNLFLKLIAHFSFIIMLVTFYTDNDKKWIVLFNTLFFFGVYYGANLIQKWNIEIHDYLLSKLV